MYWDGEQEYMAFGMGSASYVNGVRFSRPKTITKYKQYVLEE